MGLTSVARSRLVASSDQTLPTFEGIGDEPFASNDYNGFDYSAKMVEAAEKLQTSSPIFTNYSKWKNSNVVNASNLSPWYIPSGAQIKDICGMLFGIENETTSSVNAAFKAAYDEVVNVDAGNDIDSSKSDGSTHILSSYISSTNSSPAVVTTNVDEGKI